MKATIIGGNGFIGQALYKYLILNGWDCWIPARNDERLVGEHLGYIFYCAGLTADFQRRPFDTVKAHTCLLNNLLEKDNFTSLLYLSSTRLYDNSQVKVGLEESDLSLNPNNPRHLYDLSKALGESICLASGKAKVVRLSCVYNDQNDLDGFLPRILGDVISKMSCNLRELTIDTSASFSRDYVYLMDVIKAIVLVATIGKQKIYNVASGENVSNHHLFEKLEMLSGVKIITTKENLIKTNPQISISKIKEELYWQPIPVLEKINQIFERLKYC